MQALDRLILQEYFSDLTTGNEKKGINKYSPKTIKEIKSILNMAFVSILTGIIFIIVNSAYVGIGGRLGTIGAVACFVWLGIRSVIYKILKK